MNMITPPAVTLNMIRQGYELGVRHFFCQPGTIDGDVTALVEKELIGANIIEDCVMVQLNEDHVV